MNFKRTNRNSNSSTTAPHSSNAAQSSNNQQSTTQQIIAENVKHLIEQLEQGKSEALTAYLNTMARFHNYSFGNILSIAHHRPDATHVAGIRRWNEFGRYVRKGQKGIPILAPMIGTKREQRDQSQETSEKPAPMLIGFRRVYVFDIAQTEGAELPEPAKVSGEVGAHHDRLIDFVQQQGIELEYNERIAPAQKVKKRTGFDSAKCGDLVFDFPVGRTMPGGFEQFDVANVDEAIALAQRFRKADKYRYFRGQTDATWNVTSSFARLDGTGRIDAQKKICAFAEWVHHAKRLLPYLDDDDKIIASAQHHGITATTFIDFSTDPSVAGWFAADGNISGQEGAIYLVNPDEVNSIFNAVTNSGPVLRFLKIDVTNLWRLQAQSGLFLEAQCDIATIWPLDRIVFPQTGATPAIDRRYIYPDRRSHLEQMIDDYQSQRIRQNSFRKLKETMLQNGVLHLEIESPVVNHIQELDSTQLEVGWIKGPDEHWNAIDIDSPPPFGLSNVSKITTKNSPN